MDVEEHNQSFIEDVAAAAESAIIIIPSTNRKSPDVISKDQEQPSQSSCSSLSTAAPYQIRTFRPSSLTSQRRADLLPAYPLARDTNNKHTLLLLPNVTNVDRAKCEMESFCGGEGICPFEFTKHRYMESIDSFMNDLFQDLFIEPSRQWKIPYSIIDFNLSRLRRCMDIYKKQTQDAAIASFQELPLALEFFLQIDGKLCIHDHRRSLSLFVCLLLVDLFFMKTCRFGGAQPRPSFTDINNNNKKKKDSSYETEGILCQYPPTATYGMKPCYLEDCFLCAVQYHGRSVDGGCSRGIPSDSSFKIGVEFYSNQIHRFVNKYEAILNCPAVSL
jgi:hypothetical protein